MHPALTIVMAGVNFQAPTLPLWLMTGSTHQTDAETVSNPNDFALTLTLGAWSDGRFTWSTSSPVTIPPRSSVSVSVHSTVAAGSFLTATATVAWSVAGGSSGNVTANAEHDSGA